MKFGICETVSWDLRLTLMGCNAKSSRLIMLFPTSGAVNQVFSSRHPLTAARSQESTPKPLQIKDTGSQFPIWSVSEDTKSKVNALSEEAQREIKKASATAQAKTGQIELYSAKFYAACTFGGLLACVGIVETPASGLVAHE